jgi:hypothetical protein
MLAWQARIGVAAAVLGAAVFGVRWWLVVVGVASLVMLVFLSVTSPTRVGAIAWRRAARSAAWMVGGIVVAAAMVWGARQLPVSWRAIDITHDAAQTLSPALQQALGQLPQEVVVRVFAGLEDPITTDVRTTIERMQTHKPNLVLSVEGRSDDATKQGNVRVEVGAHVETLWLRSPVEDLDNTLWQAMLRAAQGRAQRVYVSSGQGERRINDLDSPGLSRIAQALRTQGVELVPLPLEMLQGSLPSDVMSMWVPAATRDAERLQAAMDVVLARGGRVWLSIDDDNPRHDAWLKQHGMVVSSTPLTDDTPFARYLGGRSTVTGAQLAEHVATRGVRSGQVHFARAFAVSRSDGAEALVSTTADAHETQGDRDQAGPFDLIAVHKAATGELMVSGDVSFASNEGIAMGFNEELTMSMVRWLMGSAASPAASTPTRRGHLLLLTPSTREALAACLLWAAPLLWLWVSVAVVLRRRAR